MIVMYGAYQHRVGTVSVSLQKKSLLNSAQVPYAVESSIRVSGMLTSWQRTEAAMIADLTYQTRQLEQAYQTSGQNFRVLTASGGQTHVNYISNYCLGGVRITEPPSFPDGRGIEMVTKRTFTIGLTAIEVLNPNCNMVMSFQESLDFKGGGKRRGLLETLTGYPHAQMWRQHTIFTAKQAGQAVGLFDYPSVPLPIWPTNRTEEYPSTHKGHPEKIGDAWRNFPISWSWEFASEYQMIGNPHIWGMTWNG